MGKLILCNNTDYEYDNTTYVRRLRLMMITVRGGLSRRLIPNVCDTKKKQLNLFVFHKLLYLCGVIQNAGDVRLINYHIYG